MSIYPSGNVQILGSGMIDGYTLYAYHYYELYNHISGIEQTLGLSPLKGYPTISSRISGIESGSYNPSTLQTNSPLFLSSNGNVYILSGQIANGTQAGFLSAADWTTFNSKEQQFSSGNITSNDDSLGVINGTNSTIGPNVIFTGVYADSLHSGFLKKEDWITFNNKLNSLSFDAPLVLVGSIVSGSFASATESGFLSNTDWSTFNSKSNFSSLSGNLTSSTPGIIITGGNNILLGTGAQINIETASATQSGLLTSQDWTTFNNKVNGATNLGLGAGIYSSESGAELQFKTLISGNGINIISDANTVTISSNAGIGSITTGVNLGVGTGIFSSVNNSSLQFKTLVSGNGITLTSDTNTITISSTAQATTIFNAPLSSNGTIVSGSFASATQSGFLQEVDWNTFNSKSNYSALSGNLTSLTAGLSIGGGTNSVIGTGTTISLIIPITTANNSGLLASGDWTTFNNKSNLSLTSGNLTSTTTALSIANGANSIIGAGTSLSIQNATALQTGLLINKDWVNFNAKSNYSALSGNLTSSTPGLTIGNGTNSINGTGTTISLIIPTATANNSGLLASGDWSTFNNKVNGATNLGLGTGVFSSESGANLQFKTLISGNGITINSDANTITISSTATGGGVTNTFNTPLVLNGLSVSGSFAGINQSGFLSQNDWLNFNSKLDSANGNLSGNINVANSGIYRIGSSVSPLSGIFSNTINTYQVVVSKFNEIPFGLINNSNTSFTLAQSPYNNSLQLFKNGIYLIPSGVGYTSFDYYVIANTLTLLTAPTSGVSMICNYTYLG